MIFLLYVEEPNIPAKLDSRNSVVVIIGCIAQTLNEAADPAHMLRGYAAIYKLSRNHLIWVVQHAYSCGSVPKSPEYYVIATAVMWHTSVGHDTSAYLISLNLLRESESTHHICCVDIILRQM